jgi:hypothetical protein
MATEGEVVVWAERGGVAGERKRGRKKKKPGAKNDIFHHIPLSSQVGNDYFNGAVSSSKLKHHQSDSQPIQLFFVYWPQDITFHVP